jgi:hypothetical protein
MPAALSLGSCLIAVATSISVIDAARVCRSSSVVVAVILGLWLYCSYHLYIGLWIVVSHGSF